MSIKIGKGGQHLGDVCWPEISIGTFNVRRDDLRSLLSSNGLGYIADGLNDPTAQAAFGSSLVDVKTMTEAEFVSVEREKKRSRIALVRASEGEGVKKKTVTWARVAVDVGTVSINVDWNPELFTSPVHAAQKIAVERVVEKLCERFELHRDFMTHTELGGLVVEVIKDWCGGMTMRRNGGVYFVPETGGETLRSFAEVLRGVGDSRLVTVPCFDSIETRSNVGEQVSAALHGEVASIVEGLDKLKTRRTSTMEARLESLDDLQNRAAACSLLMEAYGDKLNEAIRSARKSVRDALTKLTDE